MNTASTIKNTTIKRDSGFVGKHITSFSTVKTGNLQFQVIKNMSILVGQEDSTTLNMDLRVAIIF